MALHSGYQITSHLRTVVKITTSRRSAILIVLTQGPLAVKQIITLESVLTSALRTFVTSNALHVAMWRASSVQDVFYFRDTWRHVGNYSSTRDLKGFAPQQLGREKQIFFQESRSDSCALIKGRLLGCDRALDRHLSWSSNDPCNNGLANLGQAMDKPAQTS